MTLLEGMILILFTVWGAEKIKLSFRYIAAMNTRVIPRSNATRDPLNQRAIFFPALAPRDSSAASGVRNDAEIFQFLRGKFTLPIFLFLLSATISVFVSPDKRAAIGIWKAYFIEPILFLIVFLDIFRKETKPRLCGHDAVILTPPLRGKDPMARGVSPFHFTASALSIPALYISLFAIYQKFTGFLVPAEYWQPGYHRVTSFFSYPNAIGLLLAPIVIILLGTSFSHFLKGGFLSAVLAERGIFLRENRKQLLKTLFFASTALLALLAIIFAKSEGAIIALIVGGFIFLFCCRDGAPARHECHSGGCSVSTVGRKLKIAALSLLILAASSSAAIYFNYGKQWNELFNNTNIFELDSACSKIAGDSSNCRLLACSIYQKLTLQDYSGTLRRNMWKETIEMLRDRPILGAGLAGYQQTVAPYHKMDFVEVYLYPHNIILNFWSETGLLGLIAFIWLLAVFFASAIPLLYKEGLGVVKVPHFPKEETGVVAALLASMSVLLIHGLVDVPYFKNDLAILFWVIWGNLIFF
ncbi:hypothetical protein A2Y83_02870 [Candidatus Falkowbacteria bacterium RBG_13_39_14]|uniref:O-antigen ligase-related domain-containing protein n=1 Tax=Candidatus Falkowbacteria bacterium RBG_13_39_14 TaxID=1797985 RepID=A0A1F5S1V9_9BACT|nr:MAG: hypothetical protein A2Y83_02870 [Candidatus Falkowbacteria bacterium RBG_13_39_14]